MALEARQPKGRGLLQECLLCLVEVATLGHAEANVHLRSDRLVGNYAVDVGARLQGAVDELGLLVGDRLLPVDLVGEGPEEPLQDLASDVDTATGSGQKLEEETGFTWIERSIGTSLLEYAERVVQAVVLGNGLIREDDGANR